MDGSRFDRIARLAGSRASRRGALAALAGAGLGGALGFGGPDEAAAKPCRRGKQCGLCGRCKNGRCKARKDGALCAVDGGECQGKTCVCPNDAWLCPPAPACCDTGQACFVDVYGAAGCGNCPSVVDICHDDIPQCGQFAPDPFAVCGCVTSAAGATVCSSGFYDCIECTTDQECADAFGVPAVCIDAPSDCSGCETSTICMTATCEEAQVMPAAGGKRAALKRIPRSRIKPAVSSR
ncbi:MAG TPA: hypothetical protein VFU81_21760 [Thermomicrobiales bacterium]|nr:hypothetical protein [Thermomicrobiales bacterium]